MDSLTTYTIYILVIAFLLAERAYKCYLEGVTNKKRLKLVGALIHRDMTLSEVFLESGSSDLTECYGILGISKLHTMKGECVAFDDTTLIDPTVYYINGKYYLASSKGYLYSVREIMVGGNTNLTMKLPS